MGIVFSILLLLAYGVILTPCRPTSIANAMTYAFDLPAIVTGCALAPGDPAGYRAWGLRGVAKLLAVGLPLMVLLWVTTSLLVVSGTLRRCRPFRVHFSQRVRLAGSRRRRSGLYHQRGR